MPDVYEAFVALFGSAGTAATDEHVRVFLLEGTSVDEDDADDNGIKDEMEASLQFCLNPDKFIAAHQGDPRVTQWQQIKAALTTVAPVAATPAAPAPAPVRAVVAPAPAAPAAPTPAPVVAAPVVPVVAAPTPVVAAAPASTVVAAPPAGTPPVAVTPAAPAPAPASAGLPGISFDALTAGLPPVAAAPPGGSPTDTGKDKRKGRGKRRGRDEDTEPEPEQPRPQPRTFVRCSAIPLVTRAILSSERWQRFYAVIKSSTELEGWKRRARQYRDGQVENTQEDRDFGTLLLRLIEAFEQGKDVSDPDWFTANFVTGTYPVSATE